MTSLRLIVLLLLVLPSSTALAVDYFTRVAGPVNWTAANTWSTAGCGGASAGAAEPGGGAGDTATICTGHTVALDRTLSGGSALASLSIVGTGVLNIGNNATARTLAVTGNLSNAGTLRFNTAAAHVLTVSGTLTNNGTFTSAAVGGAKTVTVTGLVTNTGTFRYAGTAAMAVTANGGMTNSGTLDVDTTSNVTHTLTIPANLTNNNVLNFASDANSLVNTTFNSGATQTVGGTGATYQFNNITVNAGATANVTNNITVVGTTTVNGSLGITSTTGAKTFTGAVTVVGTWNNSANEDVAMGGSLTNNGTFTSGTGTYTFQTTAGQSWAGTSGLTFGGNVVVSATRTNNTTTQVIGNLSGASALTNAAGQTLRIRGNANGLTTLTATALNNTVEYNGTGVQTPKVANYANLTISSAGAVAFNGSFSIAGDLTDNGNFSHTGAASRVTFNGAAAQSLLGAATNTTFQNVTMANTAAAATRSLTLGHDMTVVTNLTFTAGAASGGRVVTGANKVVVQAAGAAAIANACPTDANDFIAGNLQRFVAAGGSTVAFPVGTNGAAAPALACSQVSLTFAGVAVGGGSLIVSPTQAEHPQLASSGLDAAALVNRYWTLTTTGVAGTALPAFTNYSATFNWIAADVDAGANALAFIATRYTAAAWNPTGEGAVTLTSLVATGNTALGEFAVGTVLGYNAALGPFNTYDPPPATPAGSVHGNIRTKLSGTGFSLTVVHLNAAGTALANFAAATPVTIDLMNAADNTGGFTAGTNCRTTWAVVRSVAINFAAGTSTQTVNFTAANIETNAWKQLRIRARSATETGCSGDPFTIRPPSFALSASDATWTTAGTARPLIATAFNGAPAHKAGQPFTLRVTQAVANIGNNYYMAGLNIGNPTARTLACQNPTGGAPACTGCVNGTLTLGAYTPGSVGPLRVLDATTASYTEAGVFDLDLHDTTYAQVDAADTPGTYSNAAPIGRFVSKTPVAALRIGRFVPDNFLVATNNTPQLRTFGSACAARSFTYVGQPFGYVTPPQALITARDAAGNTTTNYRECVWKITTAGPTDITQTYTNVSGPAIDTALATNAPTVTPGNGTGAVAVSAADRIAYTRSLTTPAAPFNANITHGISVRDNSEAEGNITSNTATFDGGGTGIAFDSGVDMRHGRVRMGNAVGSEKLDLPIPILAEHWAGTAFVTNAADNCTSFGPGNFALGNYQGGINAGNVGAANISPGGAFAAGVGSLTLLKPTAAPAAPGSVDICLDLGTDTAPPANTCSAATSAAQSYLQGRNAGTDYDDDPRARAAFGVFGSQPNNFIYFRENY